MKLYLQAVRDFAKRYGTVFRAAWASRKDSESLPRTVDELAFLPAHLELTESPISPAGRWMMRAIVAVFSVALLWSVLGQIEIVAVAPGKIVVGSRSKVIQPSETAVVRRILVQDGQFVRKGELLIELDGTAAAADYEKAKDARLNARLSDLRLSAFASALEKGRPPQLANVLDVPAGRLAQEQRLVSAQYAAYSAKSTNLAAEIAQREAEFRSASALLVPLEENAKIAEARAADYAKLVKDQYVGRHDYLQREQERIAADRDLTRQRSEIPELQAALFAAKENLRTFQEDTQQQTLDQLRQAREELGQYTPEVSKTQQHSRLMSLVAPVDGTVQQLAVHTVGGVVTPAQPLLVVVPVNESLEIEATVFNKDIGFIREGQAASVKIDSFPYTRYGYLQAKVVGVSRDAAQDEKLGLVFPIRLKLKALDLYVDGTRVHLSPGMSLSVEVKTGRRRVIDYLLSPLEQHVDEGLRER